MSTQVLDQNRAYRKGLILGFTMAEISILIIFCLLLATSFLIQRKDQQIAKYVEENKQLTEVKKILKNLNRNSMNQKKFDDFFQELKRLDEKTQNIEQLQQQLKKSREDTKLVHKITQILSSENTTNESIEKTISRIAKEAEFTKQLKNAIKNTTLQESSPQIIAKILNTTGDIKKETAEKIEAITEVERLKGQLANAQNKLERLGKGTEMPACWADPKNGKPEYIFKVDLTSNGLVIHNQNLPNRVADQNLLPLNTIQFDQILSQNNFLTQTFPIYQWSIKHNCRFFVIVNDSTESNQKNAYKAMLYTLESHFYKFEIK
ncbi:hypothetical protein FOLKNPGA_01745 [Legionella sp. PC1000]|uniref:hypothetical protein n=1 Tax=Legionella sp. PC1000 TaxID=2746060 RepID=UPI0015FE7CA7|nr:hypothetical protein [Legionella sp. PC1000]QLZ68965.1 hypothetical protein FOLKNPGA_01745 [Legionella sp. PC1000]